MRKFNWDEFKNKYNKIAVHCKTEEEAKDFCRQMNGQGMKWRDGNSYLELTEYGKYLDETCYTGVRSFACCDFYESTMLKMVDGTGIIGVDMVCPLGVSTPQPPNYDRVELEGTGMLVLPNSLDAPLERLELGGKTEQVTTSGKNLFDFSNLESGRINISTGALEEHNHTRRLADYIDITDITSFSFYLPGYNKANGAVYVIIYYYDKDKNYLSYKPCGDKIEKYENITPVENAVYIKVSLEQNTIDNPQNIFKVQLEKGAKSTAYEPYTGGKPSPSTEYPQEIKSVGQWNEEKQKYEVDVKVTGKNLLNEEHFFDMKNWKNNQYNMRLQPNTQYVFSRRDNVGYGSNIFLSIKNTKDDRFSQIINSSSQPTNKQSVKFKTKETGLVWFLVQNNSGINLKDMLEYAQIEVGEISTEHELYKEQTLTLTSDRQITKWDRLVEQGGQIGWLYKHKIIEDFSALVKDTEPIYGNDGGKHFSVSLQNASLNYDRSKIYSEAGVYGKDNKIHYIPQPMTTNAIIHVSDTDTIMTAKEHMHYKVIYETTESQFTHLPQSEQNAIRALKTYYPTTVITVDGGEVDPDIKVTYRKEI